MPYNLGWCAAWGTVRFSFHQWSTKTMSKYLLPLGIAWLSILASTYGESPQDAKTVRVASISFEPIKFGIDENAKTMESWFRKAAAGGAKLAVAPEGALEGYVVNEIIAKQAEAQRMHDVALTIDSPMILGFCDLAAELQICLVFGFAEKIGNDVFNCALFIDATGRICGKYHKMQLAEGYDDGWWFNRLGRKSRAFDTPLGRCGILICNDRWNPLLAKIPALDGAQFLVIQSFGSTSKSQDDTVLARGIENGLPIVEANVGVSLIVSDNRIEAVDRRRTGITFGEIMIPPSRPAKSTARDQTESEFLRWRAEEMPRRLAKQMAKIENNSNCGDSQ